MDLNGGEFWEKLEQMQQQLAGIFKELTELAGSLRSAPFTEGNGAAPAGGARRALIRAAGNVSAAETCICSLQEAAGNPEEGGQTP